MDSKNTRNALKADRYSRRSYCNPSKGWGKRVASRAGRRLSKALSREGV